MENAFRVALVDDDALFRDTLAHNLREAGYWVACCEDASSAESYVRANPDLDLILLDWKMPDQSGIDLLRKWREAEIASPVVFLTAYSDLCREETALAAGACDFLEKSRCFAILRSRIELILAARARPVAIAPPADAVPEAAAPVVTLGRLRLDRATERGYWNDQRIDLSLAEFRIVALLAEQAGRDVTYRALYDVVHGRNFVAGDGVNGYRANTRTFVKRIRQKFCAVDPQFDRIKTYSGFGYRWRSDTDEA